MLSKAASSLHSETNSLYRLRDEIASVGHEIVDLTSGNVTEHGIQFPQPLLEEILTSASRRSRTYRPDSFGRMAAREAVARYYRAQGLSVSADHILLTPGTSVSYWYAFKLLADEGDEVLCPRPSYPLFDYIAALCGVSLIPYPLEEGRGWAMDLERVESSISTRTRAIVVISPHNPTGRVAAAQELEALRDLARRHDLAILSDEVFSEFLLDGPPPPRAASGDAPLVLTLNGFSKMFALPGMKLGWMAVTGEDHAVRQAMRALELISDTFLPVNEIVQEAAPEIFARGGDFQASYAAEIRRRWDTVRGFLDRPGGWRYTAPGGGFYVTLRIEREEEPAAHAVLKEVHALAHPGYFYDIAPHHLVFSYILEPDRAREIFPRLLEVLSRP